MLSIEVLKNSGHPFCHSVNRGYNIYIELFISIFMLYPWLAPRQNANNFVEIFIFDLSVIKGIGE